MRVSGRKLRLAVGTGIASLMLMLGVSSVGATAPSAVGGVLVIVTGGGASASNSSNPTTTNTTYRDAVRITNVGLNGPTYDGCPYFETGNVTNAANTSSRDISPAGSVGGCGLTNPIIQPAAYPLWEVQSGFGRTNVLVVPPTGVPGNRTIPSKAYLIETFR